MKTEQFIAALRSSGDKQLLFTNESAQTVQSGYHLTEIKAASFDTVDCGGQVNHWRETVLQLWVPADADHDYMPASKFLRIYDKVRGSVPLDDDAEVLVEYGDHNFFPSRYHIDSISHHTDSLRVLLTPPQTTCKARARAVCADKACCVS